ncbi:MAG: helix-turn-helix transcriptional regulator [Mobilitalea sp.]
MVTYNRLWKLLIDKNMNKGDLRKITGLSSSTIAKMTNQEIVSMSVIEKICDKLDCNVEDVMRFEK